MSGWVAKRAGAAQPVHRGAPATTASAERRAGDLRLGAGRTPMALAPSRPAERRGNLCAMQGTDAVPVLALRRRLSSRRAQAGRAARAHRGCRRTHTRAAACPAPATATPATTGRFPCGSRKVRRMVRTAAPTDVTPRIDSLADCAHCGGRIVWDEVHGWLHLDGWYACRHPDNPVPREVMASPSLLEQR